MSSCQLMFPGVRSSLVFVGFGLKASCFWFSVLFLQQSQDFSFYTAPLIKHLQKTMGCFSGCLMSSAGFQKLFCGLYSASSVCRSLQCLISALTQGGGGGLLFRLTCSVVLWGGRNTAKKYHWRVWGVLAVSQPDWVCPRSRRAWTDLHP